jgi:hypothetical protein
MLLPIKAGDPRRSLASNKFYQDLNELNHRLNIISEIPFDVPVIITSEWTVEGFERSYRSISIANVLDMDSNFISCLLYAYSRRSILLDVDNVTNTVKLSLDGVIQWRLLDSTFLGTTINYPMKTSEYPNLFNMEL